MRTLVFGVAAVSVACLLGTGTAFAKPTCEEQERKEAERLKKAATRCQGKLLDKGCDAGVCQGAAVCVPNPLASPQYVVDSASGTVIDLHTCLEWEKKCDGCGGLHDVGNAYVWSCVDGSDGLDPANLCQPTQEASDACFAGTTIDGAGDATVGCRLCDTSSSDFGCTEDRKTVWEWILAVNAAGLDGHADWRILDRYELATLLAEEYPPQCTLSPCVDAVVGPTLARHYVSSTTAAFNPIYAKEVDFHAGDVDNALKYGYRAVRAVRGGL
jgi:hypothetical protein